MGPLSAPVTIPDENVISINEALALAAAEGYPMGKTTLQRKAKAWREAGHAAPVKSLLVMTPAGAIQRLDREDFLSWVFDMKNTLRRLPPQQDASRDLEVPPEAPIAQQARLGAGEASLTSDKYVFQLERENTTLRDQLNIKDRQIETQSKTIDTLLDRSKETNVLIQGLQSMINGILAIGGGTRKPMDTPPTASDA